MQCAAYGLSTDRLTPPPFNLCSNAGSTHTSISGYDVSGYDAEHVHSTSSVDHGEACSEWNHPVKPLYCFGHRAEAQFQGLGNLLIAYAIFL